MADCKENLVLRKAVAADRGAIEGIAEVAYSKYLPRMDRKPYPMLDDYGAHIRAGHAHVLVENNGAGVVGYVILMPGDDGDLLLEGIAVRPECAGRGYGRRLLEFAEQYARKYGSRHIRLYTNEAMFENLALYPHFGYRESHRALDNGYHRVFYIKDVD